MFRCATVLACLAIGSAASAATMRIDLNGTITTQIHPGYPELEGDDFPAPSYLIGVGDTVAFRGRVSLDRVIDFGDGYSVAYFYAAAPGRVFDLQLGSYAWSPEDEYLDGDQSETGIVDGSGTLPWLAAPSLLLKGGKVLGFAGWLIPVDSPVPTFDLGSAYMNGCYDPLGGCGPTPWVLEDPSGISVSSRFIVAAYPGLYGNTYIGASFEGAWDFAGSSAVIPEPGSWALMLAGFGLVGSTLRRRREARA